MPRETLRQREPRCAAREQQQRPDGYIVSFPCARDGAIRGPDGQWRCLPHHQDRLHGRCVAEDALG